MFNQAKIFRKAGNELELLYRQNWPYAKSQLQIPETEEEEEDEEREEPILKHLFADSESNSNKASVEPEKPVKPRKKSAVGDEEEDET
jgi:biopolymer transport protein ExbB